MRKPFTFHSLGPAVQNISLNGLSFGRSLAPSKSCRLKGSFTANRGLKEPCPGKLEGNLDLSNQRTSTWDEIRVFQNATGGKLSRKIAGIPIWNVSGKSRQELLADFSFDSCCIHQNDDAKAGCR